MCVCVLCVCAHVCACVHVRFVCVCIAECSNRVKVVKHSYLLPLLVHFKVYSVLLVAFFGPFIINSLHIHVLLIKTLNRNQSQNTL